MIKRLQILLEEGEYREIQKLARRRRVTVSERVRQALWDARRQEPLRDADRKLRALRAAVRHDFPTADIDAMLEEIERGYFTGSDA